MMMTAVVMATAVSLGQVELRGGMVITAPVTGVSLDGVQIGGEETRLIGWDSVKRVLGEHQDEAAAYTEIAEKAWRARLRLARGDTGLACPLFDELFRTYRGRSGPTALMAAEGRIRCLVKQSEHAAAVEAWIEALRLRRAGDEIAGDPPMLPVLDEETGLVAGLPPIWIANGETLALAQQPRAVKSGDDVLDAMVALYRRAARYESGLKADEQTVLPSHAGVALVSDIVMSRAGEAAQRQEARDRLAAGLSADMGTWREAWRRAAIGRSLLMEHSDADRTAGVFQLLHLPARFARSQQSLASLALAEVCLELDRRGDRMGAEAMQGELESMGAGSPAALWLETKLRQRRPGASEAVSERPEEAASVEEAQQQEARPTT